MEGLATTWPCVQQRRLRRDWSNAEAAEPKKATYEPQQRLQRVYHAKLRRAIDRQRKELLSAIARKLEERVSEQSAVAVDEGTVPQQFRRLVTRWRNETAHVSS